MKPACIQLEVKLALGEDPMWGDDGFVVEAYLTLTDTESGAVHKLGVSRDHEYDPEEDPYISSFYSAHKTG